MFEALSALHKGLTRVLHLCLFGLGVIRREPTPSSLGHVGFGVWGSLGFREHFQLR